MIKVILTPVTLTIDCINGLSKIMLALIFFKERYLEDNPFPLTNLMWNLKKEE